MYVSKFMAMHTPVSWAGSGAAPGRAVTSAARFPCSSTSAPSTVDPVCPKRGSVSDSGGRRPHSAVGKLNTNVSPSTPSCSSTRPPCITQLEPNTHDAKLVRGVGSCPDRGTCVQRSAPAVESCRHHTTISMHVSAGESTYRMPVEAAMAHPSPPAGRLHLVSMVSHSDSFRSNPYKSVCVTASCPGATSLPPKMNMTSSDTHAQWLVRTEGGAPTTSMRLHVHASKSNTHRSFRHPNCPCPPKTNSWSPTTTAECPYRPGGTPTRGSEARAATSEVCPRPDQRETAVTNSPSGAKPPKVYSSSSHTTETAPTK
mmetsp:Transcript_25603/g.64091  ORF Transcript_25603/g.64091 Transcript_25603/m.64091 type:complete len:314 (+) Transcript_25603:286-1227(+)